MPNIEEQLTIVIPAFRCAKYLPATVASAMRCGPGAVVIAEDRSGDETLRVARELAGKWPGRITVVENERNLGMTGNWQSAMSRVTTAYGLKLDADDLISSAYVREAVRLLADDPGVGMVGGLSTDVGEDFGLDGVAPAEAAVSRANFTIYEGAEAAKFVLKWVPYPASSTTLFRMEAWREVGGYDRALNWCSDREIWFRVARKHEIAFCDAVALYYRVLGTNVSAQYRSKDNFCYELSHMFRRAKPLWTERELRPLFRRALLRNSRVFFGSSVRALKWGRYGQVLPRMWKGFEELGWSVFR